MHIFFYTYRIDDDLISSFKITKSRKTNFIKGGDISKLMGHEKKWQRILCMVSCSKL